MSRRALLPAALVVLLAGALLAALLLDFGWLEKTNTYGNFDTITDRAFVSYLLPGTPDSAAEKVYRFGGEIHAEPIIALLLLFAIFLSLRAIGSLDVKLGVVRWLTQWAAFVVARFGFLRASGAAPVRRCTYGVFPFLNCQACEMATGGCPIGSLQLSLTQLRFPLLALVVMVITGLALGRWICGWLCPFGLLSDIFDRISKRSFLPRKAWAWLSYGVLVLIAVIPLIMGLAGGSDWLPFCATLCPSGIALGLLPFWATTGVHDFAAAFGGFGAGAATILVHLAILAVFIYLAIKITGRVFCKYLCPLGAFLGLFHRISLVRVVHVGEECKDCGKCVKKCPMVINLGEPDFITQSNCVRCGRCVKLCPTGARRWLIGFGRKPATKTKEPKLVPEPAIWTDAAR